MKRRHLLLGTIPMVPGIAGCSALTDESPTLEVTVFNQTETPYTVELSLFRNGDDVTRSEARAFSGRFDVAPDGKAERNDIAEAEPYVISYDVFEDDNRLTDQDHVHYYPADNDDEYQAFDIRPSGVLTRR